MDLSSSNYKITFSGSIQSGYVDCLNVDKEVKNQLYKYKSIDLCSGIAGQIFVLSTL
jgi:hypothetical protein